MYRLSLMNVHTCSDCSEIMDKSVCNTDDDDAPVHPSNGIFYDGSEKCSIVGISSKNSKARQLQLQVI